MGIPKFFKWLMSRCPVILSPAVSAMPDNEKPVVDCLYLDLNGLIHTCCTGLSIAQTCDKLTSEITRIVALIAPTSLLFIAVDGVSPRAKFNQQRSRRFKSALELQNILESINDIKSNNEHLFDSNCITPGTEFMFELGIRLKAFLAQQIRNVSAWCNLKLIFAGYEVPGEGEHKIVSFIRNFRSGSEYRPNTTHCIYGGDADMIMLALATHEPYVLVLRDSPNSTSRKNRLSSRQVNKERLLAPLHFVRIHILREFLAHELLLDVSCEQQLSTISKERVIDDFVVAAMLVGNDFLPSPPGIDIKEGAMELIFTCYRLLLSQSLAECKEDGLGDYYLVNEGLIDFVKLEKLCRLMGADERSAVMRSNSAGTGRHLTLPKQQQALQADVLEASVHSASSSAGADNLELVEADVDPQHSMQKMLRLYHTTEQHKPVRAMYYQEKLNIILGAEGGEVNLQQVVRSYVEGLQWCALYYSTGCPSWSWFYPFHYGPFLSDVKDIAGLFSAKIQSTGASRNQIALSRFSLDRPFTPFQQLLACLPPFSASFLPPSYAWLMRSIESPIISCFPQYFIQDRNGKMFESEAVALLPFIDKPELLSAEARYCPVEQLTAREKERNLYGSSLVFTVEGATRKLTVTLMPYDITPGRCFEAALPVGTLPSLPGYPSLSSAQEAMSRARRSKSGGSAMPMLGEVSASSPAYSVKFTSFAQPTRESSESLDAFAKLSSVFTVSTRSARLALPLDSKSAQFLKHFIRQVAMQNKHFMYDASTLTQQSNSYALLAVQLVEEGAIPADEASLAETRMTLIELSTSGSAIRAKLLPSVHIDSCGNVFIKFCDEENGVARLCGRIRHAFGISSPLAASDGGLLLSQSICIGKFVGSDVSKLQMWLSTSMQRLAPYLPSVTFAELQLSIQPAESTAPAVELFRFPL